MFNALFSDVTAVAIVISVILSAIVSLLGSMTRHAKLEAGMAEAKDLCELTGIFDVRELQDIFGPPTMNRVWHTVTLPDVIKHRRLGGYLMSDSRIDWACIAVAVITMVWRDPFADLFLLIAAGTQVAGWIAASRLPR